MICFHLLSQVSSRCRQKSPVYHHGLSFTSCHVPVVKLLCFESIVTGFCTSQSCLLPESITASAGKSSGGIVQVRRSAKDIYSVLCLVTICSPSFLIIRGWTGNAEYFRVRIPDTQFFIDHQCFMLFLRKYNFILIYLHSKGTVLFQDR